MGIYFIQLSKVDELIEKTDQMIGQIQRLKKGLMHRLLSKGIGHSKFKKVYLGSKSFKVIIPESWTVKPLDEVSKVIDVRHYTPKYTSKGYPLILPNNVKLEGLDLVNTKSTDEKDYLQLINGGRKPMQGDIIYSRNASFGVACRVESNKDSLKFEILVTSL